MEDNRRVQKLLNGDALTSGKLIRNDKISMMFSKNVPNELQIAMKGI